MTISSESRKAGPFTGNGVTTGFPFTFKVFEDSDLRVVRTTPTGAETELVLDSDYSVTLNPDQNATPGGTITYPLSGSPLPASWMLTAVGNIQALQETDLTNQGGFYPQVIEDALDRATILIQQAEEQAGRTLRLPVSDDGQGIELPSAPSRAGRVLGFDASGVPQLVEVVEGSEVAIVNRQKFTATAAQTDFTTSFSFTPGVNAVSVFLNGSKLVITDDYLELDDNMIRLNAGATVSDTVEVISTGLAAGVADQVEQNAIAAGISEVNAAASEAAAALSAASAAASAGVSAGNYYAATKSAGDTLASSLPDGATVIVTDDESQGGVRVRYTVASAALTAGVADTTVMSQFTQAGTGAVARTAQDKMREVVSVKDSSVVADGVANDSTHLQNLINNAYAEESAFVHINAPAIKLNTNVDCKGLLLICAGTKFTGAGCLTNHAGIQGGFVNGIEQNVVHRAPAVIPEGRSTKVLWKVSNDNLYVMSPKAKNGGYVYMRVLRNEVTNTNSVGGSAPLWRITDVHDIVDSYIYKNAYNAVSGSWTSVSLQLPGDGGQEAKSWRSEVQNEYIEYTFSGSFVDLGLFTTAGSANSVIVAIDGVTVETLNLSGGSGTVVRKRYFTTTGGSHTLRVTNNQALGGRLYVLGINITKPDESYGAAVDWIAYARRFASDAGYYVKSTGAQDYAVNNGTLFAGSYHGGETVSSFSFTCDGASVDVVAAAATSVVAVAKSIVIDQVTDFGWDATNRFDTRSQTDFSADGGWSFTCQATARPADGISVTHFYTSMCTAQIGFTAFDYPLQVTIPVNDAYTSLGRTEYVKQRNPTTGQVIEQFMTAHENPAGRYGGAHVWGITPVYAKTYSGPCYGAATQIKGLSFISAKRFS